MYVKIDDLKEVLNDENLKFGDVRANILGKLKPFTVYTQEQINTEQAPQVNETKNTTDATAGDEQNIKQGPHSRKLGFDRLEEVITAMIERDGMPPSIGRSFFELMKRRSGHSEKNTITLEYEKEEAVKLAHSLPPAIEQISADFIQKFKEKFNGLPSTKLFDEVKDDIAGSLRRYREDTNAKSPKAFYLEFVLSPNIGTCDCENCKVTPLN